MCKMNTESIKRLDKSKMMDLLINFPKQLSDAADIGKGIDFTAKIRKGFNKIVFTGLGGSAIGADLIRSYVAGECRVPIFVNRDYTLPAFVDKDTLLIVSSYSGNTEETLSAYDEGLKKGAGIVAITSNGELKKRAERDGFPFIIIPQGYPPRCALGYSSIPIIMLFAKLGLISDKAKEIKEAIEVMEGLKKDALSPEIGKDKNIAKEVAGELLNRYAIIYGANQHTDVVATRWRGQLAENSKAVSSSHLFPEMNHNEIVGWRNPKNLMKNFLVLILRDKGDHPRVKTRMEISKTIISKEDVKIVEVHSKGKSILSRIFSLIYIGDFVSVYLAILNGVDPTPVDSVMYLKNELAKV
ncbi:MAG: bifunctional phosphoglucose/phosphomannose isomerase [Candidatus Omnitrophica bacterium]|nr:bifunctional phosphoglucose/phosphomannose isomerase [Candidatus Omnitrophota bacterium]